MPIYEYRCAACGRSFERLVHGQQAVACPACDSTDVTRLLSLFGFKSGQGFVASASPGERRRLWVRPGRVRLPLTHGASGGRERAARGRRAPFAFLVAGPTN